MPAISQDNTRLDITATNAFAWLNGVDLSPYQTGYYELQITDSAGKVLQGYIGQTVPAGEQLDNELIGNTTFDDASWWSFGSGWSVAAGKGVGVNAYTLSRANVYLAGCLYKESIEVTKTSGSIYALYNGMTAPFLGATGTMYVTFNASGYIYIAGVGTFNGTIDNPSVKRVLDPPSTGCHIVSAQGGGTRAWTNEATGFNRKDVTGYTYTLIDHTPTISYGGGGVPIRRRPRPVAQKPQPNAQYNQNLIKILTTVSRFL